MNEHEHHGNNLASFGYLSLTSPRTGFSQGLGISLQMWSLKYSLRIFGLVQKKLTIPSSPSNENAIFFPPLYLPLLCLLLSLLLIDTIASSCPPTKCWGLGT
ncbi:hypothetical protein BJY00DRAFT_242223 [Aspergillus carlsbadensis]|nr:hypothetical protein BJY00DRAFT_242223 [Aspergillus carlsbadensis]